MLPRFQLSRALFLFILVPNVICIRCGKGLRSYGSSWSSLKSEEFGLELGWRVGGNPYFMLLDVQFSLVHVCREKVWFIQRQCIPNDNGHRASGMFTRPSAGDAAAPCKQWTMVLDGFERGRWAGNR